jgi:hypothetical protein
MGNFAVIAPNAKPVKSTSKALLTVDYTAGEIGQVGNDKRNLKLGVYLGGQWRVYQWNQLTDKGDPNNYTGAGSVELKIEGDLSDPPIAWGGGSG